MGLKQTHKIFFAIPYDSATKSMYEEVANELLAKFPKINSVLGNKVIGPSIKYSNFASFKAQNTELFSQFVREIESADIIIADLSNNNPNVHVELGIALALNKNILRVTGRSLSELGFDTRNYEVCQYKNKIELIGIIGNYYTLFESIKNLPLSPKSTPLYFYNANLAELNCIKDYEKKPLDTVLFKSLKIRDGVIGVKFKINDQKDETDWFGVFLRAQGTNPFLSSCLIYIRKNGFMDLITYPSYEVLKSERIVENGINKEEVLIVEIEGDSVKACLQGYDKSLYYEGLENQNVGHVGFGSWRSYVSVSMMEVVSRDTIDYPASSSKSV